jgi:hypothetical protein
MKTGYDYNLRSGILEVPNKVGRGLVLSSPCDRLIFNLLLYHLLFPSLFDEDAGQSTFMEEVASAY